MTPTQLRARLAAIRAYAEHALGELSDHLSVSIDLHDAPDSTMELLQGAGGYVSCPTTGPMALLHSSGVCLASHQPRERDSRECGHA